MKTPGTSAGKSTPAACGPPRRLRGGRSQERMSVLTAAGGGCPMSVPEAPAADAAQGGDVRELRLAVVLYGGASLAIYMHGTTKELQRLVKASALVDSGGTPTTPSEGVYAELLAEAASRDPDRVRTR